MTWNDITVDQFMTIQAINAEDFDNIDEYFINIIAYLEDKVPDYYFNLDYDEFELVKDKYSFLTKLPNVKHKESLDINGYTFYLKPFDHTLTTGEFIDIESLLEKWTDNLDKLCVIFYQRIISQEFDLSPRIFEKYEAHLNHRSNLFLNIKFVDVYNVINEFILFRNNIYKVYEGLFNLYNASEDEEEIDLSELDARDRAAIIEEQKEQENLKKFSWDLILYNLAKEDITKINAITELPFIFVMNMLSMKKQCRLV